VLRYHPIQWALQPPACVITGPGRKPGALRAALKFLLRRFGLKAVKIGEVRNQCRYWG
jgi:hypothetical protein